MVWRPLGLCSLLLLAPFAALASDSDPVLRWNALALDAVAVDHVGAFEQAGPGRSARALAIAHAAIYDALLELPAKASASAAVAAAGHAALIALYPAQQAAFDAALEGDLGALQPGVRQRTGVRAGVRAARRVLRERAHDGWDEEAAWTPSALPGRHREDPLHAGQGFLDPNWGSVAPFVLESGDQLRPPPPPDLSTAAYAAAYDEVKRLGGDGVTTPTERSAEQTEIGIFWGYDGTPGLGTPPRLYNQIARAIAQQQGNDVAENARLFLLVNLALADAGIACWEAKYHYDFWRPVLGVREADPGTGPSGLGDANPATVGDTVWTPLGAPASNASGTNFTPSFPAYPSGHATFGAALFRIIERFYGTDAIAFEFVSDEMNGSTTDWAGIVRPRAPRSFSALSDAAWENAVSRIYLGIHWAFDATEGVALGEAVADFVYDNALSSRGRRR
jgi:hypothetical protein